MSEYSYEIDKYIVGVDSNGEDGIGLTIATMKDNELHILGSCYGDNARFIDLLIKENKELKKQLEYLKSGEYLNQLKFERNMLEDIVLNGEISKEDKEFIDMTHRNAELLYQQKEFIEYLENEIKNQKSEIFSNSLTSEDIDLYIMRIKLLKCEEILSKYKEIIGENNEKDTIN